jgi:hypothetical protein
MVNRPFSQSTAVRRVNLGSQSNASQTPNIIKHRLANLVYTVCRITQVRVPDSVPVVAALNLRQHSEESQPIHVKHLSLKLHTVMKAYSIKLRFAKLAVKTRTLRFYSFQLRQQPRAYEHYEAKQTSHKHTSQAQTVAKDERQTNE